MGLGAGGHFSISMKSKVSLVCRTVDLLRLLAVYLFTGVQQPYSSAPCVPSDKKGFKRSLSFGATPNQGRPNCVTVRPCKKCSCNIKCVV